MAARSRGAITSLLQQLIDDPQAKLWSAANVQEVLSGTVDELWSELLDAQPNLRVTETVGTLVTPGYVDTAALSPRFHRIQSVVRNGAPYREADFPKDVVLANSEQLDSMRGVYVWRGDELHILPYDLTIPVYITYSSLPTDVVSLANDNVLITWPDGYHMAYVYATAARLMEKGDRESSERFQARATEVLNRLRGKLRKRSTGPIMPYGNDSAQDWGGV